MRAQFRARERAHTATKLRIHRDCALAGGRSCVRLISINVKSGNQRTIYFVAAELPEEGADRQMRAAPVLTGAPATFARGSS